MDGFIWCVETGIRLLGEIYRDRRTPGLLLYWRIPGATLPKSAGYVGALAQILGVAAAGIFVFGS